MLVAAISVVAVAVAAAVVVVAVPDSVEIVAAAAAADIAVAFGHLDIVDHIAYTDNLDFLDTNSVVRRILNRIYRTGTVVDLHIANHTVDNYLDTLLVAWLWAVVVNEMI